MSIVAGLADTLFPSADSRGELETPEPDKAAFQLDTTDIDAQRAAIAANPVALNKDFSKDFTGINQGLGKLGQQLSARISQNNLESDLEAKQIRNAVANFAFAPGATLQEKLAAAAQGGMKANEEATKLTTQQREKLSAQASFVRQAQMEGQLQMKTFKAQAQNANQQTALALKQSQKAMALAQQELMNQYNKLRLEARNARELMNIDAMAAESNLNWRLATAGLETARSVTDAFLQMNTNNNKTSNKTSNIGDNSDSSSFVGPPAPGKTRVDTK